MHSVLNQRFGNFEIVLVDDGSTDGSGNICDDFAERDSRVMVIHKANGGLSSARNAGIAQARGRYITFIDSDDWVAPTYLGDLYGLIEDTGASLAACGFVRSAERDPFVSAAQGEYRMELYSSSQYLDLFFRKVGNRTIHYAWGKLYRRDLLDANQFPLGIYNEDVESMFKVLLRAESVAETSKPLYCYFINQNSITGASFGENYLGLTDVWQRIRNYALDTGDPAEAYLDDIDYNIDRSYFTILVDSIIHGNRETDAKYSKEIKQILHDLREVTRPLLSGDMRNDRKVLCLLIAGFYFPIRHLYRLLHRNS